MRTNKILLICAAIFACLPAFGFFTDALIVDQKEKSFLIKGEPVKVLKIKAGDTVQFRNLDPFFHNVFSLSDAKMFDLGSFPQGQSKAVTFERAGKVEVECAIHPNMHMVIEVK